MQADDKWVMKGKLWQPSNEPFYSVSELQMMVRRADAATIDLELALGYWDFKHSWEYDLPKPKEFGFRQSKYLNLVLNTCKLVDSLKKDEASRTTRNDL